jgi:hypothetical protein
MGENYKHCNKKYCSTTLTLLKFSTLTISSNCKRINTMLATCLFRKHNNNPLSRNSISFLDEIAQQEYISSSRSRNYNSSLMSDHDNDTITGNTQLFFSLQGLPSVIASIIALIDKSRLSQHNHSPAIDNLKTLGQCKTDAMIHFFTAELLKELTLERNKAPCQISKLCLKIIITLGTIATTATYAYKKNYTTLHYIWVPALVLATVIPILYVACMIHFQHQYLPTIWHKLALNNRVITFGSLLNDWQKLQQDYTQPAEQLTPAEEWQLAYILHMRCVEAISFQLIITNTTQPLSQSNNKLYEENIQKMQQLIKQKSSMSYSNLRGINTRRLLQDLEKTKNYIAEHYSTAAQSMG